MATHGGSCGWLHGLRGGSLQFFASTQVLPAPPGSSASKRITVTRAPNAFDEVSDKPWFVGLPGNFLAYMEMNQYTSIYYLITHKVGGFLLAA